MKMWNEVKSEFKKDGALRDIYVENICPLEWNIFLQMIQESRYKTEFYHGEARTDLPRDIKLIKDMQKTEQTILSIWLDKNIHLNCHFFIETEIEFDFSVDEVHDGKSYMLLSNFIDWLYQNIGHPIKVTHEGMQNEVIICVP